MNAIVRQSRDGPFGCVAAWSGGALTPPFRIVDEFRRVTAPDYPIFAPLDWPPLERADNPRQSIAGRRLQFQPLEVFDIPPLGSPGSSHRRILAEPALQGRSEEQK